MLTVVVLLIVGVVIVVVLTVSISRRMFRTNMVSMPAMHVAVSIANQTRILQALLWPWIYCSTYPLLKPTELISDLAQRKPCASLDLGSISTMFFSTEILSDFYRSNRPCVKLNK